MRGFCENCGTSLTYQKDPQVIPGARDDVYITTRTLDKPAAYPPTEHVFYGERVRWFSAEDQLPHHEGVIDTIRASAISHAHGRPLTARPRRLTTS